MAVQLSSPIFATFALTTLLTAPNCISQVPSQVPEIEFVDYSKYAFTAPGYWRVGVAPAIGKLREVCNPDDPRCPPDHGFVCEDDSREIPTQAFSELRYEDKAICAEVWDDAISPERRARLRVFGACTAVLIEGDTILTAAHCLKRRPGLDEVVFGHVSQDDEADTRAVCTSAVETAKLSCIEWYSKDLDLIKIQLTGPVEGLTPAQLSSPGSSTNDPEYALSAPLGLPIVEAKVVVEDCSYSEDNPTTCHYFDTGVGASGGGVFRFEGGQPRLSGIIREGLGDGGSTVKGCRKATTPLMGQIITPVDTHTFTTKSDPLPPRLKKRLADCTLTDNSSPSGPQ